MTPDAAIASAHLSRYDALISVSKTLAGHRTMAELFDVLSDHLHPVVPFDYLALVVYEGRTDELRVIVIEPENMKFLFDSLPVAQHGPAATVWETQRRSVIPIPEEGPLHPTLEFIRSQGCKVTSWFPLTTAHGKVGVLSFGSRRANTYDEDALAFMEQVAAIVAVAVDNGINYDQVQHYQRELQEERDRLRFLLDVNNLLVTHLDFRELLKAISEAVEPAVGADHIGIALHDRESNQLQMEWIYDKAKGFTRTSATLPLDKSIAGVTFQRGVAGVFRRSELEGRGWESESLMTTAGVESVCCVPLVTRDGPLGALYIGSARPDAFSEADVVLLGQTSAQIAIALENALAFEQVTRRNAQLIDEKQYLEAELQHEFADIVGMTPSLQRVLKAVKTVAPTDSTVLLLGETGTGKELIARALHTLSPRHERTFVRMSVAALPPGLLESELFGHEKGAFTGATASRAGRLEVANRGTLFLDEVGDIPLEVQPKLLRVLQEREFERLGSTRTQKVDVRVVTATNRDLEQMVEAGTFRRDLYYRLNVFPIAIPPLRERLDDIPALARHFAGQCARRMARPVPVISEGTAKALKQWTWPGNIRELQNVIERAVILSPGPELHLSLQDIQPRAAWIEPAPRAGSTLVDAERQAILQALRESGGIIAGPAGAAARLGLKRTTLQSKMRKLGIRRPSY